MVCIIYYFLFMLAVSCQKEKKVEISGIVEGGGGRTIYLSIENKIDSTKIKKNGSFKFKVSIQEPNFANIYLKKEEPILFFIDSIKNQKIIIKTKVDSFLKNYTISGSRTSEEIRELHQKLIKTYEEVKQLAQKYQIGTQSNIDDTTYNEFTKLANEIVERHRQEVFEFIKKNPSSFACLPALYQKFDGRSPIFNYYTDAYYFELVDSALMKKFPNLKVTKDFHANLLSLKGKLLTDISPKIEQSSPINQAIKVGDTAPDFEVYDINGKKFKLSSLRGNFVLLDFWASWCYPCRVNNPTLVKIINDFKKYNLKVVMFSLDKDLEEWKKGVEKDNLKDFINVSDLKYWHSDVAKLYGVNAIPANFLINPYGKIIAINIFGNDLYFHLDQIFKNR